MKTSINTQDFDQKFDHHEEITDYLDLRSATRPNLNLKRVNVDFPQWMVEGLDQQANYLGVPRQALIKLWIAEKLQQTQPKNQMQG